MGALNRGLLPAACLTALLALSAQAQAATQTLSVEKPGAGTGTVTSSPAGISCGATCSAPFTEGATVVLSALPGPNSTEVSWGNCNEVTLGNECKVTMSTAKTVSATFNLQQRQLSVERKGAGTGTVNSSPAGISCGSTCSASFTKGEAVILSATPDASSLAPSWSGCDSVAEGKCTVTMNVAKAVTATFALSSHQLSVSKSGVGAPSSSIASSPVGIECGPSCSASYLHGTTVTLTATPGPHVEAAQWSGCDSEPEGKCVVTISAAKGVSAAFNLQPGYAFYPVVVSKAGTGQGTVTGSVGSILCGSACTAQLLTGTSLTLTATPAPGSVFAHWSGGGCKGAGPCTTTVKGEKKIKAVFTAVGTRTLTVTKAGTGQGTVKGKVAAINCGQTCSSQVPVSKKITLSAKAATGSTFAGWSGACSGTKACRVAMSEARSVTATFNSTATPPAPCIVPALKGKSLSRARSALEAAHCTLGRVTKPKARNGRRPRPLVVKSFLPAAGTVLAVGAKVDVRLGKAHRRRRG
jgi:hypothetical protein